MPLDAEALAELVVQTVDVALGPIVERLAATEARVQVFGDLVVRHASAPAAASPDLALEDVAASVEGLLRKELEDLANAAPMKTRRRVQREGSDLVITEEPIPAGG